MRRAAITGLLTLLFATMAYAQCEATPAVREILERSLLRQETALSQAERRTRQIAMLEEGLKKYPDDYFLLRLALITKMQQDVDAARSWSESLHMKYPERPIHTWLYAKSLEGRDTPAAIRLLDELKAVHPNMPPAYLELAINYSNGKFKDKPRAQQEIEGFLKLCPASLSSSSLSVIGSQGTPDQIARTAAAVRKRLEGENDPLLSSAWQQLWTLEFKSHPPNEFGPIRSRIVEDLARFAPVPEWYRLAWLEFQQAAYESAGDAVRASQIKDQMALEYPSLDTTSRTVQQDWQKAHAFPSSGDAAQREAYFRASLAANQEWHKRWPDNIMFAQGIFSALIGLPDTTSEQAAQASDDLLKIYSKDPEQVIFFPPLEFQVANAYLKLKMRMEQVPDLVEKGYRAAMKRQARSMNDDRTDESQLQMQTQSIDNMKLERARILLNYAEAVKQPDKAREVEADLATMNPSMAALKFNLVMNRAKAAEIQGKKLDALILYRSAMETRPMPPKAGAKDSLAETIERLWKELGGAPVSLTAFLGSKPKPVEATDSHWEKPKNPLPAFTLTDLGGKKWTLAELHGKAVLANVWATWCGPCRMEHPEFQKLYEKLKDRNDVVVLSLNVDDDLGKVEPYMKENKFTFPVLLGRDLVDAVVPALAIPRNWFITPAGKLEWEQVGYGPNSQWQDMILAKLEELLKATH